MKYCTRCHRLYTADSPESCRFCSRTLISDPSEDSPVRMLSANGFELERICAALRGEDIPCSYQHERRDGGIQILNSAPMENCDVFVPLRLYNQARDILIGIGALGEENADEADIPAPEEKKAPAEEELSPGRARAIRILSVILFLGLIAAAVFLTDFVVALIQNMFR